MTKGKNPKWTSGVAVSKGKQSIELLNAHETDLSKRIPAEEIAQHKANVPELETRVTGQEKKLAGQKSDTAAQNQIVKLLNGRVVNIRRIVKDANPEKEILNLFGVGNKIHLTVMGVAAAADTVKNAYAKYTAWSNAAGIIEKDITELTTLTKALFDADTTQEGSIYAKRAATMDKDTLQRAVEDEVTKISGLGFHEYEITNPEAAALFAALIPGSVPPPPKNAKDKGTDSK